MGKVFIACLATFVVLSFLWNSVAADEENRPAKKLLFDALGMELHDPRKRKYYVGKYHGGRHYRHKGRGRRRRCRGSSGSSCSSGSGSGSSGKSSGSGSSGSDSDSDSDHGHKKGHGHGYSSDETEL